MCAGAVWARIGGGCNSNNQQQTAITTANICDQEFFSQLRTSQQAVSVLWFVAIVGLFFYIRPVASCQLERSLQKQCRHHHVHLSHCPSVHLSHCPLRQSASLAVRSARHTCCMPPKTMQIANMQRVFGLLFFLLFAIIILAWRQIFLGFLSAALMTNKYAATILLHVALSASLLATLAKLAGS